MSSKPQKPLLARASLLLGLLALLAGAVTLSGATLIPLEDHDALVAQTAQHMLDSDDWLVPRFNSQNRLQKPPLSYWLVAITAKISGQGEVAPLVARIPSALAAAGLVLLAYWLAIMLFDRPTALLAGLFVVGSQAFFTWSHSARPDMLYAFLCTGGFVLWVAALRSKPSLSACACALLAWLAVALAILTKGPQVPAIMLAGLVLHSLLAGNDWRGALARLRPVSGLLIVAALVLPWWWLLREAVGAQALANSQLSGSLLTPAADHALGPYYFLRSPLLWLPWSLLLPLALILAVRDWRNGPGLLGMNVLLAMTVFTFGPQYREHYMLPWQALAGVLLAAGLLRLPASRHWLWLPWLAACLGLLWLLAQHWPAAWPLLLLAVPGLLLVFALIYDNQRYPAGVSLALIYALALILAGLTPAIWSESRYQQSALARTVRPFLRPGTQVVTVDVPAAAFVYYLDAPVRQFSDIGQLCGWLNARQHATLTTLVIHHNNKKILHALRLKPRFSTPHGGVYAGMLAPGGHCH